MKRIEIEMDGVTAAAELRDDLAPDTVARLWTALPIQGAARHLMWCGRAVALDAAIDGAPGEQEHPVCSIYPGHLVWDQNQLIVGYGPAEYRSTLGVQYATLVGRLGANREALLAVLERMHDEGDKQFSIRRQT